MHRQPAKRPKVPTRSVQSAQGGNYLRKAEQHLALALRAFADSRWDSAVLLSVHARNFRRGRGLRRQARIAFSKP